MKKILIPILLLFAFTLHAQRFNGGIILGINASQVDGDTYAGYNKMGLCLGAYVYTPLTNVTDIQVEIKYMGKGARNNPSKTNTGLYVNQLHYIEVPVILRFKTGSKIDLEGGLAFSYLFKNTIKYDFGSADIDGLYKTTDFSGLAGIKYKANNYLSISMRVSYSLLTIRDDLTSNNIYLKNRGVFNNVLSIALFYDIHSKNKG